MRSFARLLAPLAAVALATTPAQAAWSGDCAPPSPDARLENLTDALDAAADHVGIQGGGTPGPLPAPLPTPTPFPVPAGVSGQLPDGTRIAEGTPFLDVPNRPQKGSMCGFFAAKMTLDFWEKSAETGAPRAQDLFDEGVAIGVTRDGYVTTTGLAESVEAFGYEVKVEKKATLQDLEDAIEDGVPPIVLFVVDNDSTSPGYAGPRTKEHPKMNLGHFAVIQAVYTDSSGEQWIVAKHGWAAEGSYLWRASDFEESWSLRNREMLLVEP